MLAAAGTTNRSMPANLARNNMDMTHLPEPAEREFWRSATCTVWVGLAADGVLRFSGYDRAHLDGYEYILSVPAAAFPALRVALGVPADADLLDAVCAAADMIMAAGERSWLQAHGIAADLQTW